MQVIPAIDLRDSACVQLVGGSYADERVRIPNPLAVAENWARWGFGRIHLVDLDAATGRGSNRQIVRAILGACAMQSQSGAAVASGPKPLRHAVDLLVSGIGAARARGASPEVLDRAELSRGRVLNAQCGGGVRDLDTIAELLADGASEVVLGTRAIEERAWLEDVVERYPNRIIVAADTRARRLVTRGWSETASQNVIDFIDELSTLPLAAILVTAVEREGRMQGPDLSLMREIALRSKAPVQASGGVRSVDDLRALAELGVSAAVVGMALYTGGLDPQTIIEEFPE